MARRNVTVTLDSWEDLTAEKALTGCAFKAVVCGTHRGTVASRIRTIQDRVQIGLIGVAGHCDVVVEALRGGRRSNSPSDWRVVGGRRGRQLWQASQSAQPSISEQVVLLSGRPFCCSPGSSVVRSFSSACSGRI